jgi:hypothetical protein
MTFVFWGLFVVLGLIALGYWRWMVWVEKREAASFREQPRASSGGGAGDGESER